MCTMAAAGGADGPDELEMPLSEQAAALPQALFSAAVVEPAPVLFLVAPPALSYPDAAGEP